MTAVFSEESTGKDTRIRPIRMLTGNEKYREASLRCWEFIKSQIVCPDGEWYWSRRADGTANTTDDRAGFWKCPYHNTKMCLEIIERLRKN